MTRTLSSGFTVPTPPHARVDPTAELDVVDGYRAAMLASSILALANEYPKEVAAAALELARERTEARP